MQLLCLYVLLATVIFTSVFSCRDGVDNAFTLGDCGGANAVVQFRNIKVYTYDENKQPKCYTENGKERADVFFPGFIKLASGQVIVNQQLDLASYDATGFFTFESYASTIAVCKDGVNVNPWFPTKLFNCTRHFCATVGEKFCDMASKPGSHTVDDLDSQYQEFISVPKLPSSFLEALLRGKWHGSVNIQYKGNVIGCVVLPGQAGEYISVLQ